MLLDTSASSVATASTPHNYALSCQGQQARVDLKQQTRTRMHAQLRVHAHAHSRKHMQCS
jgi:hypothetical protein